MTNYIIFFLNIIKKKHCRNLIAILIIVLLGFIFHKNYINEFPSYKHAWAQSDRYALAKGFVNNDLNFFKPETFVLNHQFPDDWKTPSETSITAVDFPIHDFIPAVFMKATGISSPSIFKTYTLLYSFIGLFYLFKLTNHLTKSFTKSIFALIFAATSPIFVYYQSGFLPTIPSLANAFIGIYFYTKYLSSTKNIDFNKSILFLTLGALSRTTFAIPLIAVLGLELFRIIQKKTPFAPKITPVLLSISVILFYILYNTYLRNKYGSIFLNHILPAESFQEFIDILKSIKNKWMMHYFSILHYSALALLSFVAFIYLICKKTSIKKEVLTVLFLTSIIFAGSVLFALLMFRQFSAHDYYFLDTFFLPIILLLIVVLSLIPSHKFTPVYFSLTIVLISVPLVINAKESQKEIRTTGPWDRVYATINNFKDAEKYLDSLKIPKNSKLLVLDAYAPNIPFILMNRKGYAVLNTNKERIQEVLKWKYDYIIFQNEFFISDIYTPYNDFISNTKIIWSNGHISICKSIENEKNQSLIEYLGLSKKTPSFEKKMDYDSLNIDIWENTNSTDKLYFSGKRCGIVTPDMIYGLTYKTKNLPIIRIKNSLLLFQSYFLHDSSADVELILSISENGENIYYKSYNLRYLLKKKNSWEKLNLTFELPKIKSDDYEFSIFLWNTGKTKLYLDDFEFKLY